jgi:hypothetical protein
MLTMAITSERQRASPEGRRVAAPLLKASLVASLVFALAWIRWPLSASNLESVAVILVGYGILISIFAMILGFPLSRYLERQGISRWWSHLAVAAATGAVLAAIFSSYPHRQRVCVEESGVQEHCIENPRAIHLAFSPWTRARPGWIEYPPVAMRDFIGSIIFGGIVGGALGISFWYFYSRGAKRVSTNLAFDNHSPPEQQGRADWTGTIIGALLLPVFFSFVYLGKAEMGFTVCLVLGMVMIAIKLRWNLRRHAWFWVTIAVILILHIPLLFIVRWPETNIPTIAFSMPLGIADFWLTIGGIGLAEKVFSKGHSSDQEDG